MLIVVGLLSVIIITVFALQRRLGQHALTVAGTDAALIARNLLEAAAGDVLCHLRLEANASGSAFFTRLRAAAGGAALRCRAADLGWTPSVALQQAGAPFVADERFMARLSDDPQVDLQRVEALPLPPMLAFPPGSLNREVRGEIKVTCKAEVGGREYQLTAVHPFKLVAVMLPMLREFAWFFDRAADMQTGPGGDRINCIAVDAREQTRNEAWPLTLETLADVTTVGGTAPGAGPVLLGDPAANGKVFFGPDDRPVQLNLAGELSALGAPFSDLWMVKLPHFGIRPHPSCPPGVQRETFSFVELVGRTEHKLRGIELLQDVRATGETPNFTTLFVVGFHESLVETFHKRRDGLFGTFWSLADFLRDDPAFSALTADPTTLERAAGCKPLGMTLDWRLAQALRTNPGLDLGTLLAQHPLPARQIFGQALRRFFVLSTFKAMDCVPQILKFNTTTPQVVSYQPITGNPVPLDPSPNTYQDYMSRIVSGGAGAGPAAIRQTYNVIAANGTALGQLETPLTHNDFRGSDQLRVTAPFAEYREQFLTVVRRGEAVPAGGGAAAPADLRTLQGRVSRYYPNPAAFIAAATGQPGDAGGAATTPGAPGRFWVGATVVVDGDLSVPAINCDDVRGGTVIVNGNLRLGEICPTRIKSAFAGGEPHNEGQNRAHLQEAARRARPEEVLTFVVTPGHSVELTGQWYVGVHLVNLGPGETTLRLPNRPFLFMGGLALSRPDLPTLTRMKQGSWFYYLPCMATPEPPLAADIDIVRRSYRFQVL